MTANETKRSIEPVSMTLYDADFQAFADRLGTSFKRYGFAVIADHGLDEAVIDAAIADARARLPPDWRERVQIGSDPRQSGTARENLVGVAAEIPKELPEVQKRLEAVRLLSEAGIPTTVMAAPMIPAPRTTKWGCMGPIFRQSAGTVALTGGGGKRRR